jgi:putative phosphoribosyl transferase
MMAWQQGSTARAATFALRRRKLAWLIVAVPVAAVETCEEFKDEVDEIVCAETPEPFYAVSESYEEFLQTSDEEVRDFLDRASKPNVSAPSGLAIQ